MAGEGGNSFIAFILGGVVVVLAILIFSIYGTPRGGGNSVKLELPQPTAPR